MINLKNYRLNIKSIFKSLFIILSISMLIIFIASCTTTGKTGSNLKSKDNKKTINKENNNNKINNATQLIGNRNSKKLHNLDHPSCQNYVNMMNEENKVYFDSESEANKAGYYSCKKCY